MANPTATLERDNHSAMNFPASQLDEAERPRAAMKFTYPSGSRPLEGYTIKRGVGRGGFGEVYFATSDAGKEVALKLIRRNLDVELRGVTQCLNLKHPNLIGLFDIRSDGLDDQWVIMEYVCGESLEDVIDRYPNGMPIEQVQAWMRGICAGVAYLHDHGIVHRDLKPGNIFLDESTVKIGDYGLAKFISCSRRSGQTESVGTVHYMAPEIANGRYGREIDTYALGIILFEMLTGTVPFEGESVGEVLMKHLTAEPDLSQLEDPYRDIVRRALAKDPDARIKSVGEMMSLLPGDPGALDLSHVVPAPIGPIEQPSSSPTNRAAASGDAPAGDAYHKAMYGWVSTPVHEEIEEPIWKAVREGLGKLRQAVRGEDDRVRHPLMRALVVFAIVAACIWFSGEIFVLAIPALICYGVYYVVWVSLIRPSVERGRKSPSNGLAASEPRKRTDTSAVTQFASADMAPPQSPAQRYAERVRRRRIRPSWRDRANQELAAKPLRETLSELLGSLLAAALFASLAALVAPVLLGLASTSAGAAAYLWLALAGTIGSWAILVPTKFAEGRVEDQVPMRMFMLMLGGLVGVGAWALASALFVTLPRAGEPISVNSGVISNEMLGWPHTGLEANPPLAVYVTYFAFLFVLLRWWRQAEFTRASRLSLWSVAVCIFWAWLLQFFWWFPQPAGMMVAGVTSFATQMSSPWLPPSRRRALAETEEVI